MATGETRGRTGSPEDAGSVSLQGHAAASELSHQICLHCSGSHQEKFVTMAIVLTGGNQVFNAGIIKLLKRARNFKCISSERARKKTKHHHQQQHFFFPVGFGTVDFLSLREFKKQKKRKKKLLKVKPGLLNHRIESLAPNCATPDAEREI